MSTNFEQQRSCNPSTPFGPQWIFIEAPGVHFRSNEKTGKWCIFCEPSEVDARWSEIKALLEAGSLHAAKVSTYSQRRMSGHATHVICVYTLDWSDEHDVYKTLAVLRAAGFVRALRYKRDIDTMNPNLNPEHEFFYEA